MARRPPKASSLRWLVMATHLEYNDEYFYSCEGMPGYPELLFDSREEAEEAAKRKNKEYIFGVLTDTYGGICDYFGDDPERYGGNALARALFGVEDVYNVTANQWASVTVEQYETHKHLFDAVHDLNIYYVQSVPYIK